MAALSLLYYFSIAMLCLAIISASPVDIHGPNRKNLFKRTYYDLYCPILLPNPPAAPLVHSINMHAVHDDVTNDLVLTYSEYNNGEITDVLYTTDQLCDRVGCHCVGAVMICSIGGTRFYNAAINAIYNDLCTSRCRCVPELSDSELSDTDLTWSSSSSLGGESDYSDDSVEDHWGHNVQLIRAHYKHGRQVGHVEGQPPPACVPNRLQKCDLACLAGPLAGWTWRNSDCCPDYSFEQITPQEAFTNFGLPISTLVASHSNIGVCLKSG
ncbi:MAG: hypothetical protein Q9170_008203 [Blastenia crenularia]